MSNGYINLPRSLLRDPLWKSLPYTYRHVFITILEHMVWKETVMDDFGTLITLKPGQLLTTLVQMVKWCDEDDIDRRIVQRALIKFGLCCFSCQTMGRRKTIITITRSDILELIGPKKGPNSGQTRAIKEEVKEYKNIKESPPTSSKSNDGGDLLAKSFKFIELCKAKDIPLEDRLLNEMYRKHPEASIKIVEKLYKRIQKADKLPPNLGGWFRSEVVKEHEFLEEKKQMEL